MEIETKKQARIIADFNRGKINAKRARKLLARAAIVRGQNSKRDNWK